MRNAFLADQLLINRSETSFEPIEANLCIDMHIGYYKYVRLCASMLSETESCCRENEARRNVARVDQIHTKDCEKVFEKSYYELDASSYSRLRDTRSECGDKRVYNPL